MLYLRTMFLRQLVMKNKSIGMSENLILDVVLLEIKL